MNSKDTNIFSKIGWLLWLLILFVITFIGFYFFVSSNKNNSAYKEETIDELIVQIKSNYEIVIAPEDATRQYIDSINNEKAKQSQAVENNILKQVNENLVSNSNNQMVALNHYNKVMFIWASVLALFILSFIYWLYLSLRKQIRQNLKSKDLIENIVDSNNIQEPEIDGYNRSYSSPSSYMRNSADESINSSVDRDDSIYAPRENVIIDRDSALEKLDLQGQEVFSENVSDLATVDDEDVLMENILVDNTEELIPIGIDDFNEIEDQIQENKVGEVFSSLIQTDEQIILNTKIESKYIKRLEDISNHLDKIDSLLSLIEDVLRDKELTVKQKESLNYDANICLAQAYYSEGQRDKSMSIYNKLIEGNPQNEIAYIERGKLYKEMDRPEDAIDDYSKALDLSPHTLIIYKYRAEAYLQKSDLENTIADISLFIDSDEANVEALKYRAYAYLKLGQMDKALTDLEHIVALDASDAEVYFNLATVDFSQNNFSNAINNLSKSIDLDKLNANAFYLRGIAYNYLKDYEKAVVDFDTSLILVPYNADVYHNRGNAYASLGKSKDAIDNYTESIRINPTLAEAYFGRANIYYNQRQYKEALDDYTKAIEINKDYTKAYFNRGLTHKVSKQYQQALDDFEIVKEIDFSNIRLVEKVDKQIKAIKKMQDELMKFT